MNLRILSSLFVGLALIAATGSYLVYTLKTDPSASSSMKTGPGASPVPPSIQSQIPAGKSSEPTFDVVRVETDGAIVVAGRGEPGLTVALQSNGKSLESALVDDVGQFVMLPKPLPPGSHVLTLAMKDTKGTVIASKQMVTIDVPDSPRGQTLVARTEPGKPTEILSSQGVFQPLSPDGKRQNVTIAIVEAVENGALFVSGNASPGSSVRIYLNDAYLGTANVAAQGKWSIKIEKGVSPGLYKVRVDDVEPQTGKVLSRSEVAFDYAAKIAEMAGNTNQLNGQQPSVVVPAIGTATVKHGDNLWRISQRAYGEGQRYMVIHDANKEQIRDPNLIYPGQMFVLPKLQ